MKHKPGTFVLVPNLPQLVSKPSEMQVIYMWLCTYSDKEGKCFPSRKTLAKQSGCGIRTVDKYLQQLVDDGFIIKEVRRSVSSKQNLSNTYTLLLLDEESLEEMGRNGDSANVTEVQELHPDVIKKNTRGSVEKGAVTISNTNYTQLTIPSAKAESIKEGSLPDKFGRTPYERLLFVYGKLWQAKFKVPFTVSNFGFFNKTLKQLLETNNEFQVAALIWVHFNWRGGSGDDERQYLFLSNNGFPIAMIPRNVSLYIAYLTNREGVEYTNTDSVKSYVVRNTKALLN